MAAKNQPRNTITGRWHIPTGNTPESAEGKFNTYAHDLPVTDQSGADWPGAEMYPHHRPAGDVLAQGGESSPLRPRTAKLVSDRDRDTTEWYAKPRRETLHQDAMTEAGRGLPEELRYLVGDIDGSEDR